MSNTKIMLAARQAREEFEDYCNKEFDKFDQYLKETADNLISASITSCDDALKFYESCREEFGSKLAYFVSVFGHNLAVDCEFEPCETFAVSNMEYHIRNAANEVEELRQTIIQDTDENCDCFIREWQKEASKRAKRGAWKIEADVKSGTRE